MRNILVETLSGVPVGDTQVEMVERKGIGHPDSICDAIMDRVSVELSKEYLSQFGHILHHNIDKAFLVAGDAQVRFGGGTIREPMKLIFGDRAAYGLNGRELPIREIAIRTAKNWIRENLRFVDPGGSDDHDGPHMTYQNEIKPGSAELVDIFSRDTGGANDTSAAVGYWPMTETERLVRETEQYINSRTFKEEFPEAGEDVKVMGVRMGRELRLTAAVAFVDRFVEGEADYFRRKQALYDAVMAFLARRTTMDKVAFDLNTLDEPGRGINGVYLSVLGTSAESGDSGQIGRGNKVNGVIAINRPMGTEAAAGKNPVSHVGKIYSIFTHLVAQKVYEEVPGVREVYVWMVSQIGKPIDQPVTAAQIILDKGLRKSAVTRRVREVLDRELAGIHVFCRDLAEGKYTVC
ncbi:MAG TPA: methionine adenosyltransferase [bacterium]|nr:methionine adenosyltransferase [bacterium]